MIYFYYVIKILLTLVYWGNITSKDSLGKITSKDSLGKYSSNVIIILGG
jgi:hypothetical protein